MIIDKLLTENEKSSEARSLVQVPVQSISQKATLTPINEIDINLLYQLDWKVQNSNRESPLQPIIISIYTKRSMFRSLLYSCHKESFPTPQFAQNINARVHSLCYMNYGCNPAYGFVLVACWAVFIPTHTPYYSPYLWFELWNELFKPCRNMFYFAKDGSFVYRATFHDWKWMETLRTTWIQWIIVFLKIKFWRCQTCLEELIFYK